MGENNWDKVGVGLGMVVYIKKVKNVTRGYKMNYERERMRWKRREEEMMEEAAGWRR